MPQATRERKGVGCDEVSFWNDWRPRIEREKLTRQRRKTFCKLDDGRVRERVRCILCDLCEALSLCGEEPLSCTPKRLAAALLNSGQNLLHDTPMHIRQPALDAVVVVTEPLVIEAQKTQHRGVQIINRGDILDGFPSEIIR